MKYLDLTGLTYFWGKVKSYVTSAIGTAKTEVGNYTVNGKKISTNPTLAKGDVGLGNVDNVKQIPASQKGQSGGVAELDESGKVPASQLPAYVDDVVEYGGTVENVTVTEGTNSPSYDGSKVVYDTKTKCFLLNEPDADEMSRYYANWEGGDSDSRVSPAESYGTPDTNGVTPISGKIYVNTVDGKTYRWSGSDLVEISASIALGETSSTAYRGDRGKAAYDHAQAKGAAFASGLYKITTNAEGHVTAAAKATKTDITGLGIPAQDTTYTAATNSKDGLMSAEDKTLLDYYENSRGAYLEIQNQKVTYSDVNVEIGRIYTGYLDDLEGKDVEINAATQEEAGVMSATDKRKLDGLESTSALTTAEIDALFA